MPTFTAIALDRLLEPGAPGAPKSIVKPLNMKLERRHSSTETKQTQLPQISPALYATPVVTPVPDSSSASSFPPSPYIINHKRRGPRLLKSVSQNSVSLNQQAPEGDITADENGRNTDSTTIGSAEDAISPVTVTATATATVTVYGPHKEEMGQNGFHNEDIRSSNLDGSLVRTEDSSKSVAFNLERDSECEDFFDPQESMSIGSNNDVEYNSGGERSFRLTTPSGEFYDAWEELSSEGGPQSSLRDMEAELREIRLNLLTEIEKRKQAEEALHNMQKLWQRIREQLSLEGLTIPSASTIAGDDKNLNLDPGEELRQQIYIARMVSNSVGRGTARAEAEMEMESWIESKNFEIARLLDRLHYYEAVNHEMSQRNQEAVEVGRRQRQRRKRMQRWVWSSIGTAVALGAVAFAWSYLPTGTESSCSMPSQAFDGDDATKP
ncbi:uncharacterized protein LOC122076582 [Macadamia integrifolia]|uniref:uncharacterized protein LOC122076582 n=1 Tax=Macadamia integrifolia TaxID=60698 RepID=UPI001C501047|nr:uncharacterized protein LOC122076582 [Macadamia integrifolia]XP_042497902.1 uncharacterized protein LOC122076582 [Macadamia integrifolia]XP_042497903.1 uncharacterized protein LOC122076582 [Macadamia integrifolia]XP_042497904.1 uncharacterized protein LOC122076582 [Macadamia integrifolia]